MRGLPAVLPADLRAALPAAATNTELGVESAQQSSKTSGGKGHAAVSRAKALLAAPLRVLGRPNHHRSASSLEPPSSRNTPKAAGIAHCDGESAAGRTAPAISADTSLGSIPSMPSSRDEDSTTSASRSGAFGALSALAGSVASSRLRLRTMKRFSSAPRLSGDPNCGTSDLHAIGDVKDSDDKEQGSLFEDGRESVSPSSQRGSACQASPSEGGPRPHAMRPVSAMATSHTLSKLAAIADTDEGNSDEECPSEPRNAADEFASAPHQHACSPSGVLHPEQRRKSRGWLQFRRSGSNASVQSRPSVTSMFSAFGAKHARSRSSAVLNMISSGRHNRARATTSSLSSTQTPTSRFGSFLGKRTSRDVRPRGSADSVQDKLDGMIKSPTMGVPPSVLASDSTSGVTAEGGATTALAPEQHRSTLVASRHPRYASAHEISSTRQDDAKLIRSLDDLHVVRRVATGGFADVYLVRQKPAAGRYYALKAVRKADIAEAGLENQVLSEKRLLEAVSHNFIVKLHCTFQSKGLLFFVLEYIAGGDLYHALQRAGMFTESEARFYAAEIVVVFEYLHARDIIYRDLKLENILLDSTGHIKLADFGFAKHVPTTTLSFCGTPDYMAPEIIVERPYGKAVDWWSLGVLIFELLSGKTPFRGDSVKEIYLNVLDGEIQWTESLRDHARSIVSALLVHNPDLRLGSAGGASEIKAHTWFWGLDWAAIASRSLVPPIQPHSVPPIAIERSVQNPDDVLDELLIDDMAAVADDFEIDDF